MTSTRLASPRLLASAAFLFALTIGNEASCAPLQLASLHALVVDEASGKPIVAKAPDAVVPIASLTKLMTAMVVIDAKQNIDEEISIDPSDVDVLKHSHSRVPVGATLPRRTLLHLALMSSENRAAASLARTYPGGMKAFRTAVHTKIRTLGMTHTAIEEPTGLSPSNTSTATDLAKMAKAASAYPEIVAITTDSGENFNINGKHLAYHNSNGYVGKEGWSILLSKTGYTKEAGRCVIMRLQTAGRRALVVLLNASGTQARAADMANVKRYLAAGREAGAETRAPAQVRYAHRSDPIAKRHALVQVTHRHHKRTRIG